MIQTIKSLFNTAAVVLISAVLLLSSIQLVSSNSSVLLAVSKFNSEGNLHDKCTVSDECGSHSEKWSWSEYCPNDTYITNIEIYKSIQLSGFSFSCLGYIKFTCSNGVIKIVGDTTNTQLVSGQKISSGFVEASPLVSSSLSSNGALVTGVKIGNTALNALQGSNLSYSQDNIVKCPEGSKITGIQAWSFGSFYFSNSCKCISSIKFICCPGGGEINSDPQFTGFLGQKYQVHGTANTVYNIITTPKFHFNALFNYLDKGECREGTVCFSHPGNYFGSVGLLIKNETTAITDSSDAIDISNSYKIEIIAGSVNDGMTVRVNGIKLLPSVDFIKLNDLSEIKFPSKYEIYIKTSEFAIKFENSDYFLNEQISIETELMKSINDYKKQPSEEKLQQLPHGILGQTWRRMEYNNRWKYIEGSLFDYIVSDGLMGSTVNYQRY